MSNLKNDDLWQSFIKDIKKLPEKKIPEKTPPTTTISNKKTIKTPTVADSCSSKFDNIANIDGNTAKKFLGNKFKVEATLDLHGQTVDRSFELVNDFIINSYSKNLRCVLIITGKGLHRSDDMLFSSNDTLKNLVPKWLESKSLCSFILSYIHPQQALGGSGALYILLRRDRG